MSIEHDTRQTGPGGRVGVARWAADLAMGARFALTGGREGWTRTILTSLGVGLGVVLLLMAASVPNLIPAREHRGDARSVMVSNDPEPARGPDTLLVSNTGTQFHDRDISGVRMHPDGAEAPLPPGVDRMPKPGEMVISPALKELLDSEPLLKKRFAERIVGTIDDEGLLGPQELYYYAGAEAAETTSSNGGFHRIDHWGTTTESGPLPPPLVLLIIIGCVVLLLPVAIFIATAVRFGGERRDRRLAALRLVGADSHMTRRIAAGEAVFGSLVGLAVGAVLFLLARELIEGVEIQGVSFFSRDVRPSVLLATLIALAVPAAAVLVTLFALRGIAIEPLGVVRNTRPRRRRLWWRLVLPVLGFGLLVPLVGHDLAGNRETYQVAAGAVLVLIGTTALLPWVIEAAVERFRGGPVPWQLATRRLQLSSGTAARAVSGITVAVAGAIAIQMLFVSVQDEHTQDTGQDTSRAQFSTAIPVRDGADAQAALKKFGATAGVREVRGLVSASAAELPAGKKPAEDPATTGLYVGDCAALREVARIDGCKDGDVFYTLYPDDPSAAFIKPGAQLNLETPRYSWDGELEPQRTARPWTIPASAREVPTRPDPMGWETIGVLATPGALDIRTLSEPEAIAWLTLDHGDAEAVEHVRNTDAALNPQMRGWAMMSTEESREFASIRRGLFIGATATLLLIGASMIVSTLEQLRERRRLLSVLVAFGTRRSTLSWSVLWQTTVPVVIGLALSITGGLALGAFLLKMVERPISVDWAGVLMMTGIGAGVIALVTLVTLPPLWRMMRPDGLRTE
ncbi:ABC transporter permease [Streptomyces sp. LX-29]|uniref:ABC transporter permease n=1 Tax=Streptomyces sp. LX-29 TaxID=2900152 RepID=UPI00240D8BD9|nr:ABC transporter permease [Streptomyces sp. LX-29]WFB07644.1 ABC transporter permease [Streptomyces sp. LX-29]